MSIIFSDSSIIQGFYKSLFANFEMHYTCLNYIVGMVRSVTITNN